MDAVVADTGPIHYLVLIGHSEILPALFGKVFIPSVVYGELTRAEAPEVVRWVQALPEWLEVQTPPSLATDDTSLESLDDGEKAALILAAALPADLLLLMDDRQGVRIARNRGLRVIGTLRVLQLGARNGLLDLVDAFERIRRTNFRYRREIMEELLRE